jgi:hypothetical protein
LKSAGDGALSGKIVTRSDRRYHMLRSTYTSVNSPNRVLLAEETSDVVAALAMARKIGDPIAVRSGGHSLAGISSINDGTVIDLSQMKKIDVMDRAQRLVRVQPGARWGHVAEHLMPYGLAISSGNYGNVGVGGLATAGGIGWLVRKDGLTIDHLVGATIVLPGGQVVEADMQHNSELFWGIRGAGGQLGIVTEFLLRAAAIDEIGVARLQLELDERRRPLVRFDQIMRTAPLELTAEMQIFGTRAVVSAVYAGTDPKAARAAIEPLLTLGRAQMTNLQFMPYAALVPTAHEHPNLGQQRAVTHNGMVDEVTAAIEREMLSAARAGVMMQLRSLGGAMAQTPADATAFANRHQSALVIGTVFSRAEIPLINKHWKRIMPHFSGLYANFEAEPTAERAHLVYPGQALLRVRELKRRYNPDDIFRGWPLE